MSQRQTLTTFVATAALLLALNGCKHDANYVGAYPPASLGTISDPIWERQEANAEASDFVVHEHEFVANTTTLNAAGEVHVKQIAARIANVPFPVAVEPSSMTVREGTKHEFPIHGNLALDMNRREIVVRSLTALGVEDAEQRVVVAPPIAPGFEYPEAERAYTNGFSSYGRSYNTGSRHNAGGRIGY